MPWAARHAAPALALLVCAAAPARADAILQSLRTEAARAEAIGFERITREERQTAKGPVVELRVDRFDPRAPAGRQWTLVTVNGRAPTLREQSDHRKLVSSLPVPGFYRLSAILAGEPQRSVDSAGRIIYRWPSLPPGSMPTPGPDVSTRMAAEAVVEKVGGRPMFRSVRLFAPKPFPVMAVAKVNAFDLQSFYEPGANGMPMLVSQSGTTDISAPFGQGGRQTSQIRFRPL
jgi:hypothetical protein